MKFYLTRRGNALLGALLIGGCGMTARASTDFPVDTIVTESVEIESYEDPGSYMSMGGGTSNLYERGNMGAESVKLAMGLVKLLSDPNVPLVVKYLIVPFGAYTMFETAHFAIKGRFWFVEELERFQRDNKQYCDVSVRNKGKGGTAMKVRLVKTTTQKFVNYGPKFNNDQYCRPEFNNDQGGVYTPVPYAEQSKEVQNFYQNENTYNEAMSNCYFYGDQLAENEEVILPSIEEIQSVHDLPHYPPYPEF